MNKSFCQHKGCENYQVRYCRKHLNMVVKEVKKIEPFSEKQKVVNKKFAKVKASFLRSHPFCEANLEGCQKVAQDVHHTCGKKNEEDYLNDKLFLAVCRNCHRVIEDNPAWAKQNGFSKSRLNKRA